MEHYYQNIQGWSDGIDLLYREIVAAGPRPTLKLIDGKFEPSDEIQAHFVEVGSWRGRSTAFMAVEIANSGKRIQFDAVDTWMGSPSEEHHQQDPSVVNDTLYTEFLDNIEPVKQYVRPVRMTSTEAAQSYPDNSLDFVFIDADHTYEAVKQDIEAWWPKVKPGGILAGHDYNPGPDENGVDYGVGRAVRERFPNHYNPPWCWMVVKG